MTTTTTAPTEQRARLLRDIRTLAGSRWISAAIYAAVELGAADELAAGPRTAEQIAGAVGADRPATERLLRALTTLDLVEQLDGGAYALTPLGALLRSDADDSVRSSILLTLGPSAWRAWGALADCVRTGDIAAKVLDGVEDAFAWYASPEAEQVFNRAMAEGTRRIAETVLVAYDFDGIDTLVDVGGGYGALVPPLLARYAHMTATVFDLSRCEPGATALLARSGDGIADRARFVGGDFFVDPLPTADAYALKSVLHDWDDERAAEIIENCRRSSSNDARLIVIETVVPDRIGTSCEDRSIVAADLNMLVATGGRERTESEYGALLRAGGFDVTRIVPTQSGLHVVEARHV
jgi:hypothetical protein